MSDPTNTDAATVNTDAQTTPAPAGAGDFEYPDGSKPPVDPETGLPILEDRSAEFPDEAAEAVEVVGEPIIETRDGRLHRLGTGSGMAGYRGLAAKRAEKAQAVEPEPPAGEPEGTQDATGEPGGDGDTSGEQIDAQTGAEGSGEGEADDSGAASDAGEESGEEDAAEDATDETPADEGYDPSAHTVDEVTAYLTENPDQATFVLDRERAGKARKTLIGA